jgi:hypothetical protein
MRHPAKIPCVATYDDLQPHLDAIKIYTIDSESLEPIWWTLRQYLEQQLYQKFALVLHGMAGSGKTTLAVWICKKIAFCLQEVGSEFYQEEVEPYYLRTSTIDALGKVRHDIRGGVPILFDEFTPANFRGRAAMSVDELKNLCTVEDTVQLQSRYEELVVPKLVPRIFTTNAATPADWCFGIPVRFHEWIQALSRADSSAGLSAHKLEVNQLKILQIFHVIHLENNNHR